eukprot:SM000374S13842  [mRNA]  locus=s374:6146:9305:- [translate_table: standard]
MATGGAPVPPDALPSVLWVVQHLADLRFSPPGESGGVHVPVAAGVLAPAAELVYNDAPWVADGGADGDAPGTNGGALVAAPLRFVHPSVSADVGERLGARSLRRLLLAGTAAGLELGLAAGVAEAFGQHEALTTRLKHIVEMYADGPGILFELLQNADDAGATCVSFLLDSGSYGTSSLLSPGMRPWQGPALLAHNDSVFSPSDLYAISRIGQDGKLRRPAAIGRFGLGFNSVYHFTDVPGFVSGGHVVLFDPHARHLPGVSPAQPGLKLVFPGRGLPAAFPDQFAPFAHFGCDLRGAAPYSGTLFRFPLRSPAAAAVSEIKAEPCAPADVLALFAAFSALAPEALLFLRSVRQVSLYHKPAGDRSGKPQLLFSTRCSELVPAVAAARQAALHEFIAGPGGGSGGNGGGGKDALYGRLMRTPEAQLPCFAGRTTLAVTRQAGWPEKPEEGGR